MENINLDDDFYTVKQVAEKLGLAVRTVSDKLRAGEIVGVKKFGNWYVLKSDLLSMLYNAKAEMPEKQFITVITEV